MKAIVIASVLCVLSALPVAGQTPTGSIVGTVDDRTAEPLEGAVVTITNRDTGQSRAVATTPDGNFAAAALPPGVYRVAVAATGFKRLERDVTVNAGTTTTVAVELEIGDLSATVTVAGAIPALSHDEHAISGVVGRDQIENLPLNGRNFLDLAKLEPGVSAPIRGTNNRLFVPVLGAGVQTNPRIGSTLTTVDGGNVNSGTIGAALQVSQEAVQEFQLSTVNFDPATGLTTSGAVNIVTRSGGSRFEGSAFAFYRDHRLSAYPGLQHDPRNPDPFFRRLQFGGSAGGPLKRDRAFFFAAYERNDQRSVVAIQPATPEFAPLGGVFPSPYTGDQLTVRVDARVRDSQQVFVRHTLDANGAFAPNGSVTAPLPSAWSKTSNAVNQTIAGLTSVLSPSLVNELRFSRFALNSPERPADTSDCPACIGVGAPLIMIPDAGLTLGRARTLDLRAQRIQATDRVDYSRGSHRFELGFDWERLTTTDSIITLDPAQITLWSPAAAERLSPTISLPASFVTIDDILRLPLENFQTAVGPGSTPEPGFGAARVRDLYRLFAGDTWKARSNLSVNAGLAWSIEPNALNYDLTKPELLAPLLGAERLGPPRVEWRNIAPRAGLAWTVGRDGRTVIRGGVGRYLDPLEATNSVDVENERVALLPLGTTRLSASGSNIVWNGRPLDFSRLPTTFTGADLLAILPALRDALSQFLDPGNRDFSVRNIDKTKEASNLFDPSFGSPHAVHVNIGIQRELRAHLAITADVVLKEFGRTTISGVDFNHWTSAQGPVLRRCTVAERSDVSAACSNGPITFDVSAGRARYLGLLVRVDKRLGTWQLLASYALGSYVGTNGTGAGSGFDNNNWNANIGPLPTDRRHQMNVAVSVNMPRHFQVALNLSAASAPPFSAYVAGLDFNGDGTSNDLLPGSQVDGFGRGLGKADLAALVERYNQQVAGHLPGATALSLPSSYSFNDSFFSVDVRLSRTFSAAAVRVSPFIELFNLFNTANLLNYGENIGNAATFGQPGARFAQVFGSGGPRAAQIGLRIGR